VVVRHEPSLLAPIACAVAYEAGVAVFGSRAAGISLLALSLAMLGGGLAGPGGGSAPARLRAAPGPRPACGLDMSVGSVLVAHAIEQAVRGGAKTFDFLRGAEDYKYAWGAQDRMNKRRRLTRR